MHLHRLMALTGTIIGVIGLFFTALSTDGEGALPGLSQASDSFPDGIPTIWGGLDTWAQWVLVILIIVVVALAFMGLRNAPYDNTGAGITSVIGVALLAYALVKYFEAGDDAEALEGAFAQAFGAELIPAAWTVSPSIGFFVLMLGTVIVAAAGVLSFMASSE